MKLEPTKHKTLTLENKLQQLEKTNRDLFRRLEQLSSLLDHIPGMAFRCLYDKELTFEYAREGSKNILGYDPDKSVSGYAFRQMVHKEDQALNKNMVHPVYAFFWVSKSLSKSLSVSDSACAGVLHSELQSRFPLKLPRFLRTRSRFRSRFSYRRRSGGIGSLPALVVVKPTA